jgi:hypothetical protein
MINFDILYFTMGKQSECRVRILVSPRVISADPLTKQAHRDSYQTNH